MRVLTILALAAVLASVAMALCQEWSVRAIADTTEMVGTLAAVTVTTPAAHAGTYFISNNAHQVTKMTYVNGEPVFVKNGATSALVFTSLSPDLATPGTFWITTALAVYKLDFVSATALVAGARIAGSTGGAANGAGAVAKFTSIVGIVDVSSTTTKLFITDYFSSTAGTLRTMERTAPYTVATLGAAADVYSDLGSIYSFMAGKVHFISKNAIYELAITATKATRVMATESIDNADVFTTGTGFAAKFGDLRALAYNPATAVLLAYDTGQDAATPKVTDPIIARIDTATWTSALVLKGRGTVNLPAVGSAALPVADTKYTALVQLLASPTASPGFYITTVEAAGKIVVSTLSYTEDKCCAAGSRLVNGVCTACGRGAYRAADDLTNTCTPCDTGTTTDGFMLTAGSKTFCSVALVSTIVQAPATFPEWQALSTVVNSISSLNGVWVAPLATHPATVTNIKMTQQIGADIPANVAITFASANTTRFTPLYVVDMTPDGTIDANVAVYMKMAVPSDPSRIAYSIAAFDDSDMATPKWVSLETTPCPGGLFCVTANPKHFSTFSVGVLNIDGNPLWAFVALGIVAGLLTIIALIAFIVSRKNSKNADTELYEYGL